jgi:hypothetical protein
MFKEQQELEASFTERMQQAEQARKELLADMEAKADEHDVSLQ